MNSDREQLLQIYLQEYDKLKGEQAQRIGFHDTLIYTTLASFGALLSFVVTNNLNYYALLIAPWICVILGWTYLVNDEKISTIGRYIRDDLNQKMTDIINSSEQHNDQSNLLFGWETFHRSDAKRIRRKYEQFIIDQITFVFSGLTALSHFWFVVKNKAIFINIICGVELLLLLALAIEIFLYADFKKDIRVDNDKG